MCGRSMRPDIVLWGPNPGVQASVRMQQLRTEPQDSATQATSGVLRPSDQQQASDQDWPHRVSTTFPKRNPQYDVAMPCQSVSIKHHPVHHVCMQPAPIAHRHGEEVRFEAVPVPERGRGGCAREGRSWSVVQEGLVTHRARCCREQAAGVAGTMSTSSSMKLKSGPRTGEATSGTSFVISAASAHTSSTTLRSAALLTTSLAAPLLLSQE